MDKEWKEMNPDEKADRLRQALADLRVDMGSRIMRLEQRLEKLLKADDAAQKAADR
jgi:hypothetical protein